jgi:25S rRNA (uracil2843-N3)-methyltransferase
VDILLADGNVQRNVSDSGSLSRDALKPTLRVACFGGGAAEVIAFGGFIRYLKDDSSPRTTGDGDDASINQGFQDMSISNEGPKIDLLLLDVAQWQVVVQKLHSGLITQPTLSKYASASAKEANTSLITDENLSTRFRSEDILEMGQKELVDQFGQVPMLLTLLFTLNELYTTSIGKTTAFLLNLTAAAKPGSLLLVVDSPGSYSETTVGAEAK